MRRWYASLKIRWSSALTSSSFFRGPKFFQIDHLLFELGMTLFLYGATLRERALEVLSAGMHWDSVLHDDRTFSIDYIYLYCVSIVTDLVQSATTFREAAGIYHHLAHDVLPPLQTEWEIERPPEALASVSTVMSLICLAEAQVGVMDVTFFGFYVISCGVISWNLVNYIFWNIWY